MKLLKTYKHTTSSFSIYDEGIEINSFSKKRFIKIENIAEVTLKKFIGQLQLRLNGTNETITLTVPTEAAKLNEHVRLEQFMLGKIGEDEFMQTLDKPFLSEEDKMKQTENEKAVAEMKESFAKHPIKTGVPIVIALCAIVAIVWSFDSIFTMNSGSTAQTTSAPTSSEADLETEAFIVSTNYVEKTLKSPSTADFPFMDYTSTHLGGGRYLVQSYVDAENSFGATIRSEWMVTIEYKGGEEADPANWQLDELVLDGEVLFP